MLRDKYQSLIAMAEGSGATDLKIQEQGNVLHIHGSVPSEAVKQQLWDEYNRHALRRRCFEPRCRARE